MVRRVHPANLQRLLGTVAQPEDITKGKAKPGEIFWHSEKAQYGRAALRSVEIAFEGCTMALMC